MKTPVEHMRYHCPNCRADIEDDGRQGELKCANGHVFHRRGGVLVLLEASFEAYLTQFGGAFRAYRAERGDPPLSPSAYAELPFGAAVDADPEWQVRRDDLRLILERLPAQSSLRILDVGAWNGWLSQQLSRFEHRVTAVAYFGDERDGLGARRHYPDPAWQAIQMDELDLDSVCQSFDLVVLNRCVQFSPDPAAQVEQALRRVAPGGQLIATGLNFYRDPSAHVAHLAVLQRCFHQAHGKPLFLRPTRAYLDSHDLRKFEMLGLRVKPYSTALLPMLKANLRPTTPRACFAVWHAG